MMPAITTKASSNTLAGAIAAAKDPTATPTTAGSAQARSTAGTTRPFARCAQYERTAVGAMMASEVPTQSCMRTSSGTPSRRNTSNSTGTMTAPPPMPNNPASRPETTPPAITAIASQASSARGAAAMAQERPYWRISVVSSAMPVHCSQRSIACSTVAAPSAVRTTPASSWNFARISDSANGSWKSPR